MTINRNSTRPSDPCEAKEWDAGYSYGYDDNRIPYWHRPSYSVAFLLGYDAGKSQIDREVEAAWGANQRDGEWL